MNGNKIYLISDTHFNHETMVLAGWRSRFSTAMEMNEYIIRRWNSTVANEDVVFHLGDVVMKNKSRFSREILPRLNGNITFIKGNHDPGSISFLERCTINYRGTAIELCHDPSTHRGVEGFICHGHLHSGGLRDYGFPVKRVSKCLATDERGHFFYNVNVEFHNYRPVLLNQALGELWAAKRDLS